MPLTALEGKVMVNSHDPDPSSSSFDSASIASAVKDYARAPAAAAGGGGVLMVDPLPLRPLHPPQRASRSICTVSSNLQYGRCSNFAATTGNRTCYILQHAEPSPSSPYHYYAIDRVLFRYSETGVMVVLATPVKLHQPTATGTIAPTTLTPCGDHQVVIKAVPHPGSPRSSACVDDPRTEIAAMQLLHHHPNVIPLLDCLIDKDYYYLVLPYMEGGDLFTYLDMAGEGGLEEEEAVEYFYQICEGLLEMKRAGESRCFILWWEEEEEREEESRSSLVVCDGDSYKKVAGSYSSTIHQLLHNSSTPAS